jgi:hypothetical protein
MKQYRQENPKKPSSPPKKKANPVRRAEGPSRTTKKLPAAMELLMEILKKQMVEQVKKRFRLFRTYVLRSYKDIPIISTCKDIITQLHM